MAALTTALLFLLAARLFGPFPALLAAGLWTLYPRALWYIRYPNSEVLFTFLLYAALLCVLSFDQQRRIGWAALAGALLGGAALVRPIALLLGPLVALWFLWQGRLGWRQRLLAALLLLLANGLLLLPWEVYLWQREGQIILLSVNGSSSVYDGITWAVAEGGDPRAALLPRDVLALQQRAAARGDCCATSRGRYTLFCGRKRLPAR